MVSARSNTTGLTLGTDTHELLDLLKLKGCIVTIDTMGT